MNFSIQEFLEYAGLSGFPLEESGRISLRLESGMKVTIEPDESEEQVLVSVFYPCPWRLLDIGMQALSLVHYKNVTGRAIAAGIVRDRLVLSTRLSRSRQAPQEIERTVRDLCALVERCSSDADVSGGHARENRIEPFAQ